MDLASPAPINNPFHVVNVIEKATIFQRLRDLLNREQDVSRSGNPAPQSPGPPHPTYCARDPARRAMLGGGVTDEGDAR